MTIVNISICAGAGTGILIYICVNAGTINSAGINIIIGICTGTVNSACTCTVIICIY